MTSRSSKSRPLINSRAVLSILMVALALAYCLANSGPAFAQSAATQQFFGFSGVGGGHTGLPASCSIADILKKNQALLDEITQLNNDSQAQIKAISDQQTHITPGDTATRDALDAQQQQILDDSKAKLAAIKAEQEVLKQQTIKPSDQCKRDTVAQAAAEISSEASFFSGGGPTTLVKVQAELTKIENMEPTLQASGVNNKDMASIKSSVAAVKGDTATLSGFFSAMSAKASAFLSQANANPLGTYDAMQGGGGPLSGVGSGAAGAADNLVTSFTNLVNLFDKLSGTGGQ